MSFLKIIANSFIKLCKGEESLNKVIWLFGAPVYLIVLFGVGKLIVLSQSSLIDKSLSSLVVVYFLWHIFVTVRCSPKKPKLSKEEKKKLKDAAKKDRMKKIARKLFLKESFVSWNTTTAVVALDLLFVAHFAQYIL